MTRRSVLLTLLLFPAVVTVALALDFTKIGRAPPPLANESLRADRILVEKSERRLMLFKDGKPIAEYRIALGPEPIGDKQQEGDGRTPEGLYSVDLKNNLSAFHLSLRVSYPDRRDVEEAEALGVLPGGDIMIHGLPNGLAMLGPLHRMMDWTDGCIAVTNKEIEAIWAMTDVGTVIEIRE
jgi:murein L,D-transpeptidase YafK